MTSVKLLTMLSESPIEVVDLAAACVNAVEQSVGIRLDYSQDTLPILDHYLRDSAIQSNNGDKNPSILSLVGPMAGAYFGEVLRTGLPGARWRTGEDYTEWRIEFQPVFLWMNPIGFAVAAIFEEDLPEWRATMSMFESEKASVNKSLEALGEVRGEDYYRLAVRFEAIETAYTTLMRKRTKTDAGFSPEIYDETLGKRLRPNDEELS